MSGIVENSLSEKSLSLPFYDDKNIWLYSSVNSELIDDNNELNEIVPSIYDVYPTPGKSPVTRNEKPWLSLSEFMFGYLNNKYLYNDQSLNSKFGTYVSGVGLVYLTDKVKNEPLSPDMPAVDTDGSFSVRRDYLSEQTFYKQNEKNKTFNANSLTYNSSYLSDLYNEIYLHYLNIEGCEERSKLIINDLLELKVDSDPSYILSRYIAEENTFSAKFCHKYIKNEDLTYIVSNNIMLSYDGKIFNSTKSLGKITTYLTVDNNYFVSDVIYPKDNNVFDNIKHINFDKTSDINVDVFDRIETFTGVIYAKIDNELITEYNNCECRLIYALDIFNDIECNRNNANIPLYCQISSFIEYTEDNELIISFKFSESAYKQLIDDTFNTLNNFRLEIFDKENTEIISTHNVKFSYIERITPEFEIFDKNGKEITEKDIENGEIINIKLKNNNFKITSVNVKSATKTWQNISPKVYFDDNFKNDQSEFQVVCLGNGSFNIFITYFNPSSNKLEEQKLTINILRKDLDTIPYDVIYNDNELTFYYGDSCCPTSILPIFSDNNNYEYTTVHDYANSYIYMQFVDPNVKKDDEAIPLDKIFYLGQNNVINSYVIERKPETSTLELFALDDTNENSENVETYIYSINKELYIKPIVKVGLSLAFTASPSSQGNSGQNAGVPANGIYNQTSYTFKSNQKLNELLDSATSYEDIADILPKYNHVTSDLSFEDIDDIINKRFTPNVNIDKNANKESGILTNETFYESNNTILRQWNILLSAIGLNSDIGWEINSITDKTYDENFIYSTSQKNYTIKFNKKSSEDNIIAQVRLKLTNTDYISLLFELEDKIIIENSEKSTIPLIKWTSIKISGVIDGKPAYAIDSSGCLLTNGKLTISENTISKTFSLVLSSVNSNKRVYLTFPFDEFAAVNDDIFVTPKDNYIKSEGEPKLIDYIETKSNKIKNFADIYDLLEYEMSIDKDNIVNYLCIGNDDINVYVVTRDKLIKLYDKIDINTCFSINWKDLFTQYKYIYALIIESKNKNILYGYELNSSFSEIFKSEIIFNRIKKLPIYYYDDVASSWYDDEKYDNLLPDASFYNDYANITTIDPSNHTIKQITIDDNVCYVLTDENKDDLYKYALKYKDDEGNDIYPPTLYFIGYQLYYAMMPIIKDFGWNKNDNSSDLMFNLLSLDKFKFKAQGNVENGNKFVDVLYIKKSDDNRSELKLLESQYFDAYIDNVLEYWRSRIPVYQLLIDILDLFDPNLTLIANLERYVDYIGVNKYAKKLKIAQLLSTTYANKFKVEYWLPEYYDNRIWCAGANELLWRSFIHILLDDIVDLRLVNDSIMQDIYRYGFMPIIRVPEVDENTNKYRKYTIIRKEEKNENTGYIKLITKPEEIKDEVNDQETFKYLFNREGYISAIDKTTHDKIKYNYWPAYFPLSEAGEYSIETIVENDEIEEGILYHNGVKSYMDVRHHIKPCPDQNIDNDLYVKKYGLYSIYAPYSKNEKLVEIRRKLGKQNETTTLSGNEVLNYWIEADRNYLVKMHSKNIVDALRLQISLNTLFITELEKIAHMIPLCRNYKRIEQIKIDMSYVSDLIKAKIDENKALEENNSENQESNIETHDNNVDNNYNAYSYILTDFNVIYADFDSTRIYSTDKNIPLKYAYTYTAFSFNQNSHITYYRSDDNEYVIPITKEMQNKSLSYTYHVLTRSIDTVSMLPTDNLETYVDLEYDRDKEALIVKAYKKDKENTAKPFEYFAITNKNINYNQPVEWSKFNANIGNLIPINPYSKIENHEIIEDGYRNCSYALMYEKLFYSKLGAISYAYNYSDMLLLSVNKKQDNTYIGLYKSIVPNNAYTYIDLINNLELTYNGNNIVYLKPDDNNLWNKNTVNVEYTVNDPNDRRVKDSYNYTYAYITDQYCGTDLQIYLSSYVTTMSFKKYYDSGYSNIMPNKPVNWVQLQNYIIYLPYVIASSSGTTTINITSTRESGVPIQPHPKGTLLSNEKYKYKTVISYASEEIRSNLKYYLGTASEWQVVQDHVKEINDYMKKVTTEDYLDVYWQPFYDGTKIYDLPENKIFWTSSQKNVNEAWPMFFTQYQKKFTGKFMQFYVRPFVYLKSEVTTQNDNIKIEEAED